MPQKDRRRTVDLSGGDRVKREAFKFTNRLVGHRTSTATQIKLMQGICVAQICVAIAFWVVASLSDDPDSRTRNILTGVVGFLNSALGMYGSHRKDRGFCMFFFILEIWNLVSCTLYLYSGVELENAEIIYCEELNKGNSVDRVSAQSVSTRDCAQLESLSWVRIVFSAMFVALSIAGAYLSLRLSEKIQEDESEAKEKLRAEREGRYRPGANDEPLTGMSIETGDDQADGLRRRPGHQEAAESGS